MNFPISEPILVSYKRPSFNCSNVTSLTKSRIIDICEITGFPFFVLTFEFLFDRRTNINVVYFGKDTYNSNFTFSLFSSNVNT